MTVVEHCNTANQKPQHLLDIAHTQVPDRHLCVLHQPTSRSTAARMENQTPDSCDGSASFRASRANKQVFGLADLSLAHIYPAA